jgi:hypothetical protein
MNRRDFLLTTGLTAGGAIAGFPHSAHLLAGEAEGRIRWQRSTSSRLFSSVTCDGSPLIATDSAGLLDGACRLNSEVAEQATRLSPIQWSARHGPLQVRLSHRLHKSDSSPDEDLLEATLAVNNESDQPQQIELTFSTSAQPARATVQQQAYLPLNAAGLHGDMRFASLGVKKFLKDCNLSLDREEFRGHYLEPGASYPVERETNALLLVPAVDIQQPPQPWHIALFASPEQPARFRSQVGADGRRIWQVGRVVTIPARQSMEQSCWLMIHKGDASTAWKAFHRYGHDERYSPIGWAHDFKVHYYDYLSSAAGRDGHRGDGYDAALTHFREFHVGLGTQHGYYLCLGDHIHPDRKTWLSMQGDNQGPVRMSIAKLKERIKATRATGTKAGIYMHLTVLDDASDTFYSQLATGRRISTDGQPMRFGWNGPDVKGNLWWMSIASPEWREHLLQQAQWIMEILQPDAICMDETFSGIGYDEAHDRSGPLSPHAIKFFQELHALVRSFGDEKAFFTSDCSMSGFSLWADGDVGDHAYPNSLGHPLYRQEPVRYLAALGDKPWRPCAWHFRHMWKHQMALARQVGAGVGVSNGWIEYSGLHGLPAAERSRIIRDIESIL